MNTSTQVSMKRVKSIVRWRLKILSVYISTFFAHPNYFCQGRFDRLPHRLVPSFATSSVECILPWFDLVALCLGSEEEYPTVG